MKCAPLLKIDKTLGMRVVLYDLADRVEGLTSLVVEFRQRVTN